MKLDITKLIQLVGVAMSVAEKVKGAKGGKEKEAAVIASVQEAVPQIENITGVDFVNDPALSVLMSNYIAARVALVNGIAAAKALKPATTTSGA